MATTWLTDRITIDPAQCSGKPCVRGLRLPVEHVLGLMAAGADTAEVLGTYPDLEPEDIPAILAFAAMLAASPAAAAE